MYIEIVMKNAAVHSSIEDRRLSWPEHQQFGKLLGVVLLGTVQFKQAIV